MHAPCWGWTAARSNPDNDRKSGCSGMVNLKYDLTMRLFSYGTLQFPEVLAAVTGCHLEGERAVLEDYACYLVGGKTYPGITPEHEASVEGVVYTGIGEAHFRKLDHFEGELYERVRVCLTDTEGNPLQAWTYVIKDALRDQLTRTPWNKKDFELEHLPAFLKKCRAGEPA
jgi:gamma-glutamylcyclotransferase (GGCT)/AIG2-like uncharacterized protein YtfP